MFCHSSNTQFHNLYNTIFFIVPMGKFVFDSMCWDMVSRSPALGLCTPIRFMGSLWRGGGSSSPVNSPGGGTLALRPWGPGDGCPRGWVAGAFLGEPGLAGLGPRCCGEGKGTAFYRPYTDDSHRPIEGIRWAVWRVFWRGNLSIPVGEESVLIPSDTLSLASSMLSCVSAEFLY